MAGALVRFEGVDKRFGANRVLRGIDLALAEGEVLAVIGPSGSGKSTLIRCINGLEPIDSGRLTVLGSELARLGRRGLVGLRGRIGMVFQSFNLYPHLSALDNIALAPIRAKGMPRRQAEARAMALLERVRLAEKARAYPAELSGGQQQRVAIARALAMEPELLLFDEPTSALDPEMVRDVLEVIAALAEEGTTMAIVTHEMRFARQVAHRVVFMDAGRIVESGPPAQLMQAPRMARTREFMAIIDH